jgi:hypothetical protein
MRNVAILAILLILDFKGVAGAAQLFDSRDAHAFDAMVVSLDRSGFRYVMTDYHTDVPVWQRQFMGQARLKATTVLDFQTTTRYWPSSHPRAIAVGDHVKIYGFQRSGSTDIDVYRLEDRGAR